ncbi:AAA family ATPase [Agromyces seonyuensis]|uniref:Regulator n=1 Tax=Agromyces seonyuensis TaxID=2662446 RepID=A0A6I4P601_9MICO|nr:regulator [Agromyces seonyuensis]MWB99939.1 regulator [Agromyces seonyuensis]
MPRVALALEPALERVLAADLLAHEHPVLGRFSSAVELAGALHVLRPELVLVSSLPGTLDAPLIEACDVRGIRIVALAGDPIQHAHARGLGLREIVDLVEGWPAVEAALAGIVVPGRAAPDRRPSLIAVWGPTGAPGRTSVAVNLAAELAHAGRATTLVDADSYGGAVAPALGLLDEAPGFAAACRLAEAGALDRGELERLAQHYAAPKVAFEVFTGFGGAHRWPELGEDRATTALEAIRDWSEVAVVDTGFSIEQDEALRADRFAPRRNAATFAALGAADRVVLVGSADPVGLARLIRAHAGLIELVDAERVDVLVNRVRASVLGIDPHGQVRQTLRRFAGIEPAALLPYDGGAADAALLTARPLLDAAPRSALRQGIRAYAAGILGAEEGVPKGRRRPRPGERVGARASTIGSRRTAG